jgi:hypothetical protein
VHFPEEEGVPAFNCMLTIFSRTICNHSWGKMPQVVVLLSAPFHANEIGKFVEVGQSERLVFKVKKLPKYECDLKVISSEGPNQKRYVFATLARKSLKPVWKLEAECKMSMNPMKHRASANLGPAEQDYVRKAAPYCRCVQKIWQNTRKLLLRLGKETSEKFHSFTVGEKVVTNAAEENQCNRRYPHRPASVDCWQNVQVSPFLKVPAKV